MLIEICGFIFLLIVVAYLLFMWPRSMVFGAYPYEVKTNEKIIALSFDDGPCPPFTADILLVLAKHQVPGTFFLIGKNLEKHPDLARHIVAAGHTVGNHAYSHNFLKYFSQPSLRKEIQKTQEIIFRTTGKKPALFRSPWMIRNFGMIKTLKNQGLKPIGGIFSSESEPYQTPAAFLCADALRKVKPGRIIIFHDGIDMHFGGHRRESVKAVDLFITEVKKRGYQFVTVDQLLKISPYQN